MQQEKQYPFQKPALTHCRQLFKKVNKNPAVVLQFVTGICPLLGKHQAWLVFGELQGLSRLVRNPCQG